MLKSLKKTIVYSEKETKEIIESQMKILCEMYGFTTSKIIESMILCNIAPQHPRASIWKAIQSDKSSKNGQKS
ncbi:hypothetical protein [Faecalicoccus pleomorphus]|uniref:hypothetical protein n=1 Tax=Faecalicoccus pleomorphus TaxID=1323 RepID=UPI0026F2F824|nr:hypothetical protein [Faecalicoccus pleomorphus]